MTVGDSVTLECSVIGDPCPTVAWYQDKKPVLPHPERLQMFYDGECASMKFFKINPKDSARYTCVAKNLAGEARTTTRLNVKESEIGKEMVLSGAAPKLKKFLKDLKVSDGECINLSVELAEGTEPFDVVWLHDNCEIQDSRAFRYVKEGPRFSLIIADVFPEDSGIYQCQLANKYGQTDSTCVLSVEGISSTFSYRNQIWYPTVTRTCRQVGISPCGVVRGGGD